MIEPECYASDSLESAIGPHSYVEGRPFFGTYQNRAQAVAHAQRVGACVEPGGFLIQDREPEQHWALDWQHALGYAVMGRMDTNPPPYDSYRFVWMDQRTGTVHRSMWYNRDAGIRIEQMTYTLNIRHFPRYTFWTELRI